VFEFEISHSRASDKQTKQMQENSPDTFTSSNRRWTARK